MPILCGSFREQKLTALSIYEAHRRFRMKALKAHDRNLEQRKPDLEKVALPSIGKPSRTMGN